MAYGLKYKSEFHPLYQKLPVAGIEQTFCKVEIWEDGFFGISSQIEIVPGTLTIESAFENWESYICGVNCEFDIRNMNANHFIYDDLMYATERKYLIKIMYAPDITYTQTLFVGYINTDLVQQKYLHMQVIHIVASSFISKLEYSKYPDADILKNVPLMTLIAATLKESLAEHATIGSYDINVVARLMEDSLRGHVDPDINSVFDKIGCNTEVLWEDNVKRKNGLQTIEDILKTFNCYMYWHNMHWYIIHYNSIWQAYSNPIKYFVQYPYDFNVQDASGSGTPSTWSYPIRDIQDLVFINQSQVRSVTPGNKIIVVETDSERSNNLVVNDFVKAQPVNTAKPYPKAREIKYWNDALISFTPPEFNTSYKTILNSIKRTTTGGPIHYERGLYFGFYIMALEGSQLSISFKHALDPIAINWINQSVNKLPGHEFKYYWYLRFPSSGPNQYIWYDKANSVWTMSTKATEALALNETIINGDQVDAVNYVVSVSINIPLDEVVGLFPALEPAGTSTYYQAVFCIGVEEIKYKASNSKLIGGPAWFGDVFLAISGDVPENNHFEGVQNSLYLNKKEITLALYDSWNLAYKGGLYKSDSVVGALNMRTFTWYDTYEATDKTLVDWILYHKFRLGNIARQRIQGTIALTDPDEMIKWHPLALFEDSLQPGKKFVLTALRHDLYNSTIEITLDEYDNTTPVNLIPV